MRRTRRTCKVWTGRCERDYLHVAGPVGPVEAGPQPRSRSNVMPRIYVSQAMVDAWLGAGRTRLDGDLLRLPAEAGAISLYLNPAVHVERIDGKDADPYGLVGTVRSTQELAQMGGELYDASVVLGEHAYSVRPGYLAIPVGEGGVEAMFDAGAWSRLVGTLQALAHGG